MRGEDGRDTTRRYSDLEMPTRAYANLVVVCPVCGYAAWRGEFERGVGPEVASYARQSLARSARRAATEAPAAYQHLMNILHARRAPIDEQIAAGLHYSYTLKRLRPYGGIDPALERKIVAARVRAASLIERGLQHDPPKSAHVALEWRFLAGELMRLARNPQGAAPLLKAVCEQRRQAGFTVGQLACEMAERATRGETWEDYRDGVFDMRGIEAAEKDAVRRREAAAQAAAEAEKVEQERRQQESAGPPPRDGPPRGGAPLPGPVSPVDDPYAPAPPPIAR